MKRIFLVVIVFLSLQAQDHGILQYTGVNSDHDGVKYLIARDIPQECFELEVNNKTVWEGKFC